MRTLLKRDEAEAQADNARAMASESFWRRAALNRAVGMSARCPWAYQLSEDELADVEVQIAEGNPPLPIWTEPNGLRILADPGRERK